MMSNIAKVRVNYVDGTIDEVEADLVQVKESTVNFYVDGDVTLCVNKSCFKSYKAIGPATNDDH